MKRKKDDRNISFLDREFNPVTIFFFLIILLFVAFIGFKAGLEKNKPPVFEEPFEFEQINFSEEALNMLNRYYIQTKENEFSVCLKGEKRQDVLFIEKVDSFQIGNSTNVKYSHCWEQKDGKNIYVGNLHKHPDPHIFYASLSDYNNMYLSLIVHKQEVEIIMFDVNKFNVFTEGYWFDNIIETKGDINAR